MELNELKLISASNIITLRTNEGMTQAELGARLNYSDKTVSKWERGEAVPDALALMNIAEIFGVSVDYILSSHDEWEAPKSRKDVIQKEILRYRPEIIIAIVLLGVFTAALTAFVTVWLISGVEWRILLVALSVDLLVLLILECVLNEKKHLQLIVSLFILSLFADGYFIFIHANLWQIFLIAVPCLAIANLSFYIRRHPRKDKKQRLYKS